MKYKHKIIALFLTLLGIFCSNREAYTALPRSVYQNNYDQKFKETNISYKNIEFEHFKIKKSPQIIWKIVIEVIIQRFNILDISYVTSHSQCLTFAGLHPQKYKHITFLQDIWIYVCVKEYKDNIQYSVLSFGFEVEKEGQLTTYKFSNDLHEKNLQKKFPLEKKVMLKRLQYAVEQKICGYEKIWLQKLQRKKHNIRKPKNILIKPKEYSKRYWDNLDQSELKRSNYLSTKSRLDYKYIVLEFPKVEQKIQQIIDRLNKAIGIKIKIDVFIIADHSGMVKYGEGNARAMANGDIFLTTELLHEIEDENELAGIIAHELAHIYEHHAILRNNARKKSCIISSAFSLSVLNLDI